MKTAAPERMLTFRSGGWLVLLSFLFSCFAAWYFLGLRPLRGPGGAGDGRNVASYGFDLQTALIPREEILAAGFAKDGIEALTDPPMLSVEEAQAFHERLRKDRHAKFIVPGERVVGVCIGGEAQAYPVRLLAWHQIVNTTIGGVPVAITHDPLCDSTVAFDRRVNGETLTFGVSGLVYNSNLLMYDRRPEARGESLWSQLLFRAVAGPAAARGEALTLVRATVLPWSEWQRLHPNTTILKLDESRLQSYKQTYQHYYGSDDLKFAVRPLPARQLRPYKTPGIACRSPGGEWTFIPQPDFATAGERSRIEVAVGNQTLHLQTGGDPRIVWIEPPADCSAGDLPSVHCFWFAWHAMHGD